MMELVWKPFFTLIEVLPAIFGILLSTTIHNTNYNETEQSLHMQ